MRPLAWLPALAGMLLVAAPAWGQGFLHQVVSRQSTQQAAACAHCGDHSHRHHAGFGHQLGDGTVPCAKFAEPDTSQLPPITLSRYAESDEFECTKRVYGDGYPLFPGYWFYGQRYPLPHDYRGAGGPATAGLTGGGPSGGRGVGVGSQLGSGFEGIEPSGPQGGHGVGVGSQPSGEFEGIVPSGPEGGHGVGVQ